MSERHTRTVPRRIEPTCSMSSMRRTVARCKRAEGVHSPVMMAAVDTLPSGVSNGVRRCNSLYKRHPSAHTSLW